MIGRRGTRTGSGSGRRKGGLPVICYNNPHDVGTLTGDVAMASSWITMPRGHGHEDTRTGMRTRPRSVAVGHCLVDNQIKS